MARAFFGGMIKKDCRGDLALVVVEQGKTNSNAAFLYPVLTDEFAHLTGVHSVTNPLVRAYICVSQEAVEQNGILAGINSGKLAIDDVDKMLVESYFLEKSKKEVPKEKIVLEIDGSGKYRER